MSKNFPALYVCFLSAFLLDSFSIVQSDVPAIPERLIEVQEHEQARQHAIASLGNEVNVVYGDLGKIRRISGDLHFRLPLGDSRLAASGDVFLEQLRLPFNLKGDERLVAPSFRGSPLGHFVIRYRQEIDDIPVVGGFLNIRFGSDGRGTALTADLLVDNALPREPSISEESAGHIAAFAAFPVNDNPTATQARLVYYPSPDHSGALAWEVIVGIDDESDDGSYPNAKYRVFVDALSGHTLGMRSTRHHHHDKHRVVYSANGSHNLTAQLIISEGGSTGDFQAMSVYNNAGVVYDYFQSKFNYKSIDGNDATINSTIKFGTDPGTAGFDDLADWFIYGPEGTDGDGNLWSAPGNSVDVVTHEMMHSVTTLHRSQLDPNFDEAWAIGEALSDIFAATVDAHVNSGVRNESWWHANDVFNAFNPSVALRYMDDPANAGDIDNYENFAVSLGPHANAGIANLAFYLLTEGGTHPRGVTSVNVQGIGIAKAEQIFWEAIGSLPADVEFAGLRQVAADEAEALYGSTERDNIHLAFDAVNIPGGPNQPPSAPASLDAWSEMCQGFHSATWAQSDGATSYELRASFSTDFSIAPVMASGSPTSASWFEIPHPDPVFLGVRACNAVGCSDYTTNFQQYTWFQGCL